MTEDVVRIARTALRDDDKEALLILADSLEESGCSDWDLPNLKHLKECNDLTYVCDINRSVLRRILYLATL